MLNCFLGQYFVWLATFDSCCVCMRACVLETPGHQCVVILIQGCAESA